MILAVLLILYVAIGLMIESVLNAFLDEVGEHLSQVQICNLHHYMDFINTCSCLQYYYGLWLLF